MRIQPGVGGVGGLGEGPRGPGSAGCPGPGRSRKTAQNTKKIRKTFRSCMAGYYAAASKIVCRRMAQGTPSAHASQVKSFQNHLPS